MRSKIVAVCAVAALAIPALSATSLGCDKETRQAAAECASEKTAAVEAKAACSKSKKAATTVAAGTSGSACSKSKKAAATVAAGTSGSACSKSKKAATTVAVGTSGSACSKSKDGQTVTLVAAGTGSACCAKAEARTASDGKACPAERTMQLVVRALRDSRNCGTDCAARANLVAALRTMAKANPQLACDTMLAAMTCEAGPRPAQARVAAAGCDAPCGTQARNVAAADAACDPAACASKRAAAVAAGAACGTKTSGAACGTQARTIAGSACCAQKQPAARKASAGSACQASKTRYVAFGCDKTDSVARAAAQAYLQVMRAIKHMSGAEGCAAKAASNVLASVLDDLSPRRTAEAPADGPAVETATVSLGAVSDEAKKTCGDAEAN